MLRQLAYRLSACDRPSLRRRPAREIRIILDENPRLKGACVAENVWRDLRHGNEVSTEDRDPKQRLDLARSKIGDQARLGRERRETHPQPVVDIDGSVHDRRLNGGKMPGRRSQSPRDTNCFAMTIDMPKRTEWRDEGLKVDPVAPKPEG